jgi:hypothetical protein
MAFSDFVSKQEIKVKELPLCHTTDAYCFRSIIDEKRLNVTPCQTFSGEALVYLFYGRPSYRLSSEESSSLRCLYPICFVMTPVASMAIKRIAPFDSGAFNSHYKRYFHHKMKLQDFLLLPNQESILKLISFFFETNENYFTGNPSGKKNIPPLEFEVESYFRLISDHTKSATDDRQSTIEVQYDSPVSLTNEEIKLLILPKLFLQDESFLKRIVSNWPDIDIKGYSTFRGSPKEFHGLIFEAVRSFLIEKKYIDERNY